MFVSVGKIVAVAVGATIVVVFAMGAISSGKVVECPECENRFNKPAFSQRKYGIGIGLGSFGEYACPRCGYRGRVKLQASRRR